MEFEGEYLNDRILFGTKYDKNNWKKFNLNYINFKGKEYDDNGKLVFEGEYLNGQKNGKGKEYWNNAKLKFEGEYLNDKRNGYVKEYDYTGQFKFESIYINGKRNGEGFLYSNNNVIFSGKFINNNIWEGKRFDEYNNILYELKDGIGLIKEYDESGNLEFEGQYSHGQKIGKGKEYNNYGDIKFEGEFLYGKKHGKEKEYYSDGKLKFEGIYLYDAKIKGKFYVNEKLEYEGDYLYNKKWNGNGYDQNGNIIYKLINGNGKIKEYNEYGELEFEGEYLNGKRNGKGKEYHINGKLKFEGEYLDGKKNGTEKEYDYDGKLIFIKEYSNNEIIKGFEVNYKNNFNN